VTPFHSRLAGIRRLLRRAFRPSDTLLAQKIRRAGGKPSEYRKLLAMDYSAGMAVLQEVSAGERPSLAFLAPRSNLPATLAKSITGNTAGSDQERQRLYSGQLVQLLLLKWITALSPDELQETVQIEWLERLRDYQTDGRGVVLLGSHFGPARLIPYILPQLGLNLAAIMPHDFGAMVDVPLPPRLEMITLVEEFGLRALANARQELSDGRALHSTGDGLRLAAREQHAFLDTRRPFPVSQQMLAAQAGYDCLPVFIRADSEGRLTLRIEEPLDSGTQDQPAMARAEHMLAGYISALEERWREDFGNVPIHSLQLYAKAWDKPAALAERLKGSR